MLWFQQAEMTRHLNHVMQILRQLISNPQLIQESQARPIAGPVVHNTSTILNQGVPSSVSSLFQPHNSPAVFPQPGFGVPQTQGPSSVGDLGAGLEYNNPFAQTGNPFSQHSTSSHIPEQHTIQGGYNFLKRVYYITGILFFSFVYLFPL